MKPDISASRPRIAWNLKLFKDWKSKSKPAPEYLAVEHQLPTKIINPKALRPFGYNPSIIDFNGRTFLAYRWHARRSWETSLQIAELDQKFNVIQSKPVNLPGPANDDPRLFTHAGSLYVAYVNAMQNANGRFRCTMRYGKLIEGRSWEVEGQIAVKYGRNLDDALEKNWVPFSYGGRIQFVYQTHGEQICIEVDESNLCVERKSGGAKWIYGDIRGGTTPMVYGDKWLRFFHSKITTELGNVPFRYFIGALTTETTPPFKIIDVSRKPILYGSSIDSLSLADKDKCPFRLTNVVFPLGCIARDGKWLLSVGINHGQCGLVTVSEGDLKL